jgi:hypothetical protein
VRALEKRVMMIERQQAEEANEDAGKGNARSAAR